MIIAVDPGKETGVWVIDDEGHAHGNEYTAQGALVWLNQVLQRYPGRRIYLVGERFTLTREYIKMTRQYEAIEMIGVLRWFSFFYPWVNLVLQSRDVKSRVPDDVLRRLGWWKSGSEGHMHDAQRHALVWAASSRITRYEELVKRAFDIVDLPLE